MGWLGSGHRRVTAYLHEDAWILYIVRQMLVFCFSMPPVLASKIHPQIMFFQDAFVDTLFCDAMLSLYAKNRSRDPFRIQWAPKCYPTSTKWRLKAASCNFYALALFRSWFADAFQSPFGLLLVLFWYSFGYQWLPFASFLVSFSTLQSRPSPAD